MKTPRLILASGSPRRRELLATLGIPFRVEIASVPELSARHTSYLAPREICLANAAAKARAVARRFPHDLVLGADTEVALGARVFGKPRSRREAASFLGDLSGATHHVITAVCLVGAARRFRLSFTDTTRVTFHPLSARQIARYLDSIQPLDKAGAYAIQENGAWIVERIDGSLSNVVGLPLASLRDALARTFRAWNSRSAP
ncbi:MAG: septum formation protein Maf [Verrucomicrobiales bacterium]|nr:septum formation protein Maf [Verrucomicrobiales bacterium]